MPGSFLSADAARDRAVRPAARCPLADLYGTADQMFGWRTWYDPAAYSRAKMPKVFVGEYGAAVGDTIQTLQAALGEAASSSGWSGTQTSPCRRPLRRCSPTSTRTRRRTT